MDLQLISVVITFFSVLAAACSAFSAYRSNKISATVLEKDDSRSLLELAQLSLERAYNTLTDGGKNIYPPLSNRLNWLETARYIEQYKDFKSRITDKTHLTICDQQEKYWRHRFHLVLGHESFNQKAYFSSKSSENTAEYIEPRSAVVIFAFSKWKEQQIDPIDAVKIDDYISDGKIFNGRPGFKLYIESYMQRNKQNSAK